MKKRFHVEIKDWQMTADTAYSVGGCQKRLLTLSTKRLFFKKLHSLEPKILSEIALAPKINHHRVKPE